MPVVNAFDLELGFATQRHDRAFAELLLDLLKRRLQAWFTFVDVFETGDRFGWWPFVGLFLALARRSGHT